MRFLVLVAVLAATPVLAEDKGAVLAQCQLDRTQLRASAGDDAELGLYLGQCMRARGYAYDMNSFACIASGDTEDEVCFTAIGP